MSTARSVMPGAARAAAANARNNSNNAYHLPPISTTRFDNLVGAHAAPHRHAHVSGAAAAAAVPVTTPPTNPLTTPRSFNNSGTSYRSDGGTNTSSSTSTSSRSNSHHTPTRTSSRRHRSNANSTPVGAHPPTLPRPPSKQSAPTTPRARRSAALSQSQQQQEHPPYQNRSQSRNQSQHENQPLPHQLCAVIPVQPGDHSGSGNGSKSRNGGRNRSSKSEKVKSSTRQSLTNPPPSTYYYPNTSASKKEHSTESGQHQHHHRHHQHRSKKSSTQASPLESALSLSSDAEAHQLTAADFNNNNHTNAVVAAPPPPSLMRNTMKTESQYRKADATMMEFLRTFLAERKGTSSTRRESLPISAFISTGNNNGGSRSGSGSLADGDLTSNGTEKKMTQTPAKVPTAIEPYEGLTPQEMQELFVVLQDLSNFMSPNTNSLNPTPAQQQQQQLDQAASSEKAAKAFVDSDEDEKADAAAAQDAQAMHADTQRAAPTSDVKPAAATRKTAAAAAAERGAASTPPVPETTQAEGADATAGATNHVRFADDAVGDRIDESRKKSVEGRYKATLKSLEDAAGDCQLALRRVEEFSASLYTLVETWMHLHDNRFDEFARAVLQRLIDNNPSYHVLFYHTDVATQSLVIMDMIGRAVVAFTHPADMLDIMGEMGARHNLYGLQESHFIAMRNAFLEVYGEFVGPETYHSSVGAWKMFWKSVIELAVSGSLSDRGEVYTQRRYVVWAERVKSIFKILIPRQRSGGFHRLMQKTYKRAVAKHPQLDCFEMLADLRTAHRTMETLIRITNSVTDGGTPPAIEYNDQFSIQNLFTECGAEFDVDVMKQLEDPFLDACESYLTATGTWNIVVRATLQELWSNYITGYWTAQPASGDAERKAGSAPDGKEPFCLMFTDIEASTRLWDSNTQMMGTAVRHHHKLIRGLIEDFGGYEVKTVGDSFLIATHTVAQALLIAFGIQLELMTGPSAPGFHMVDNTQGGGDASCWRDDALRVRVGIHYCTDASAVYDSVHNRFDYYGPSVNCAARIEAAACGGQVLLSQEALTKLKTEEAYDVLPISSLFADQLGKLAQAQEERGIKVTNANLTWFSAVLKQEELGRESLTSSDERKSVAGVPTMAALTNVEDVGCQVMKGIAEPVQLYSLLPAGLEGRTFEKDDPSRTGASRANLFASSQFGDLETLPSSTEDGTMDLLDTSSAPLVPESVSSNEKILSFSHKSAFLEPVESLPS